MDFVSSLIVLMILVGGVLVITYLAALFSKILKRIDAVLVSDNDSGVSCVMELTDDINSIRAASANYETTIKMYKTLVGDMKRLPPL